MSLLHMHRPSRQTCPASDSEDVISEDKQAHLPICRSFPHGIGEWRVATIALLLVAGVLQLSFFYAFPSTSSGVSAFQGR